MMLPCQEGTGVNLKSAIRGCLLSDRHIHRINFMRVEFSPADGPKPVSLALRPALVDLGPASRSIRQFGLEDQMPSRPGLPQASGRLWIARTQEPSPPDAINTVCKYCLPITVLSPWYATSADATTQELDICSKPKVQK